MLKKEEERRRRKKKKKKEEEEKRRRRRKKKEKKKKKRTSSLVKLASPPSMSTYEANPLDVKSRSAWKPSTTSGCISIASSSLTNGKSLSVNKQRNR
jgi:hypothetical protein